jgi:SAM-dependent methyltransferase
MNKWPKTFPELTADQKRISDDFMKYWHEVLPKRYGIIEKFNHNYPVRHAPKNFRTTLEIGAGLAEHLKFEKLNPEQRANYTALELRKNMVEAIRMQFPEIKAVEGDCQQRMDFPDGYFDRVLAIHVLEHLPDLPKAVKEVRRICASNGTFSVVIPCEGSLAYSLARSISAKRIFEKIYKQSYNWFIEREHINKPAEIIEELEKYFKITHRSFFPIPLPFTFCNLCIGLTLKPHF